MALELMRRPGVTIGEILNAAGIDGGSREVLLGVEADIKYEGFVARQQHEVERLRRLEDARIPEDTDYDEIAGLLRESRAKLKEIRPLTVGQASRISGVTPSDVAILIMHIAEKNVTMFHVKRQV